MITTATTTVLELPLFLPDCSIGGEFEICVGKGKGECRTGGKTVSNDGDGLGPSYLSGGVALGDGETAVVGGSAGANACMADISREGLCERIFSSV